MNEFKSAVAYRLLGPRKGLNSPTPESLENVIIDPLPDGALCWVNDEDGLYALDKESTAAVSPPDVIATSKGPGVPGRWSKYIPVPLAVTAPVNVNTLPAEIGVALTAARADHKHDIDTGVPTEVVPGDAADEGTGTELARADHVHAMEDFAAPVAVGTTNIEGTAATFARSDHVHAQSLNPVCGPIVNGAFEEFLPAGGVFVDTDTWWTSPAKVTKLVETTYTRNAQNLVTQMQTVVYSGGLPVQTITDTITYSGMFVLNVSRSVV